MLGATAAAAMGHTGNLRHPPPIATGLAPITGLAKPIGVEERHARHCQSNCTEPPFPALQPWFRAASIAYRGDHRGRQHSREHPKIRLSA